MKFEHSLYLIVQWYLIFVFYNFILSVKNVLESDIIMAILIEKL
jgi:hypothetical protein